MKIKKVAVYSLTMKLKSPYTIAYETYDSATNIFFEIHTKSGLTGFSCAAPDEEVTGETPDQILKSLNQIVPEILVGKDALMIPAILSELKMKLPTQPGVIAAVDMALFDLLGKKCKLPLWKVLGGFREKIVTSITIGICPEEETVKQAIEFVQQGFLALKLKGGLNVEEDIARIFSVREVVGKEIAIRFDANQGYDFEDAVKFVRESEKAQIELIEQPTAKNDLKTLEQLGKISKIPIMADESLVTVNDALRIAQIPSIKLINIKLMKLGGIFDSQQANSIASAANQNAMIGCMDESALSIAAGLHFAFSHPNIKYADLDGHFDLIDDPFPNAVKFKDGYLLPTDKPGIGY